MKFQHAPSEAFSRMLAGQASRDEAKAIVRHLLAGCGLCIKKAQNAQTRVETPDTWNYDRVFARVESLLDDLAPERPASRRVWAGQRR